MRPATHTLMKVKERGLLENITILDLADEQGSFCSRLLADLGATVIKIEKPEGDPSRNTPAFFYHNTNKLGTTLDLGTQKGKAGFFSLVEKSDIVVETWTLHERKAFDLNWQKLSRMNPSLVHLSITGFGQTGPKNAYRSNDTVAAAAGGQMFVSGVPSGRPVKLSGSQPHYAASLFGASALLLGLRKRTITGKGCHFDLSIQESVASMLDHVMIDFFQDGEIAGRNVNGRNDSFTVLRCRDGHIQIPIFRNWRTLIELMDSEGKVHDLSAGKWQRKAYRAKHHDRIIKAMEGWTGDHTKQELFELGQAMQFPWAPIESTRDVLKSPQLKSRRFFMDTQLARSNIRFPVPRLPYKFSRFAPPQLKPAPLLGEHTRFIADKWRFGQNRPIAVHRREIGSNPSAGSGNILKGIRILDLTRMLSGPYATRILGDFGAEVIKVQSKSTAKGAERNESPYFCALNRNKRSICLNLNNPDARDLFLELVSISDVIVENFSPRVMANWGLSPRRLMKVKPDLVMASISAMGQTGPWKNRVGFAPTFHALSGFVAASSYHLVKPINIGHAYGDVVAGLYASLGILSALEYRDATGKGQHIDLSAYEAVCTLLGPAFMEVRSTRSSNRCGLTPGSCYPCFGNDRWCVIEITNDDEWLAFRRIVRNPEWGSDKFSTVAKRKKNRLELDRLIAQWTSSQKAETIVRRLQKAGIAAAVVQNAADLAKDSQLDARRFYISLNHPLLGKIFSDRSALWPWREKPLNWKAAPLLGEDNRYVFCKLLGHSDAEMRSLIKKGAIR